MTASGCIIHKIAPEGFRLGKVEVRLASPCERRRWDAAMDEHHYLGFRRFAGRGLRYVVAWGGLWLALAGWQHGAFKCKPRDRWIGWRPREQFERLDLIANNTRFLVLAESGVFPHLASFSLAAMTRRLCQDWEKAYGQPVMLAETFVDPSKFRGFMYEAAGWTVLGRTKGYARSNGRYTEPHGEIKQIWVRPLRRDARRIMSDPDGAALAPPPPCSKPEVARMRSLREELGAIPDFRRTEGRKHAVASALAVWIVAQLCGFRGYVAAAEFAAALSQEELEALGAWRNRRTGRFEAISKSTLQRILVGIDPDALQDALARYATPRIQIGKALAADGKRNRRPDRRGDGYRETVALIEHGTGMLFAGGGFGDEGGEVDALHDLLERADVRCCAITLDAPHAVRNTARLIVGCYGADYAVVVGANCAETFEALGAVDWERRGEGGLENIQDEAGGRIERRSIDIVQPLAGMINYPHASQIARVVRLREDFEMRTSSCEIVYVITSLGSGEASPQRLLDLIQGHWSIDVPDRGSRDDAFGEDDGLVGNGGVANDQPRRDGIALAVVYSTAKSTSVAKATFRRNFDPSTGCLTQSGLKPVGDRLLPQYPSAGRI